MEVIKFKLRAKSIGEHSFPAEQCLRIMEMPDDRRGGWEWVNKKDEKKCREVVKKQNNQDGIGDNTNQGDT